MTVSSSEVGFESEKIMLSNFADGFLGITVKHG